MTVTECGKEARSVNCEPMDKTQIEGGADQGERANDREASVIKGLWLLMLVVRSLESKAAIVCGALSTRAGMAGSPEHRR